MILNQTVKAIFEAIKNNGINHELSAESKQNLEISNVFNVFFMLLVIPFVLIFRVSPIASLITSIPILAHLISFLLVRNQNYKLGRLIFSTTTTTTVYFVAALLYNDDGTDGMAAKFLMLGTIMLPFIVFSVKEWHLTILVLCLNLFYLVSFNYTNAKLNLALTHNVDTPGLRMTAILTEFIMFSSIFFFYKKVIIENNQKLDESNKQLVLKNEELSATNATKNKFFSIISHDLRGPMHSILGCAEILHKRCATFEKEELLEFAESFYKASINTNKIVENLLTWSQTQMNTLKVNIEEFNVSELILDVVESYECIAENKGVSVMNLVDNNIQVLADTNHVRLVLQNLISNAVKFSKRGGDVILRANFITKDDLSLTKIYVSDCGIGMDKKTVNGLFKPDQTFSNPGTENEKGTGLGLLLCKEFIELNNGDLSVISAPGKGSEFCFTLPLTNTQPILTGKIPQSSCEFM